MICKTCKHWGSENDRSGEGGSQLCQAIGPWDYRATYDSHESRPENPHKWNSKEWHEYRVSPEYVKACKEIDERNFQRKKKVMDNMKAYVQDGSSYWAGLYTAPHFGCPLWEKKDG